MFLVFSDLDASLLDHETYSFSEAKSSLQLLARKKIPLILASSKTKVEINFFRKKINNNYPFIYENGSGIFFEEYFNFGISHKLIKNYLLSLQTQFSFELFSNLSIKQIEEYTGLKSEEAKRSQAREFSEPIIWNDSKKKLDQFKNLIKKKNMLASQGGRFLTISGQQNKANALLWVKKLYETRLKQDVITIALGDSENDIKMLEIADHAVLIRHPKKDFPAIDHPSIIRTTEYGPSGWNNALISLVNSL